MTKWEAHLRVDIHRSGPHGTVEGTVGVLLPLLLFLFVSLRSHVMVVHRCIDSSSTVTVYTVHAKKQNAQETDDSAVR